MSKTAIHGSWVVGFEEGEHVIYRDGVAVYEDDHILYAGKRYAEPVDRRIDLPGRLISPGLINTHLHVALPNDHYQYEDPSRADQVGLSWLNAHMTSPGAQQQARPSPQLTTTHVLRLCWHSGTTTVLNATAPPNSDPVVEVLEDIGGRIYAGCSFGSSSWTTEENGAVGQVWDADDSKGMQGLEQSVAFFQKYYGKAGGRYKAMLSPSQSDTVTPAVLKATAEIARRRDLPITTHASYTPNEVRWMLQRYRKTPIELFDSVGLLGENVIIGHCLLLSGHSWVHYPCTDDVGLLARTGTSIAHAPIKYAAMGMIMESFSRLLKAGVNVTIATDFSPHDLLPQMRTAGLMSKVADGTYVSGTPREVFNAATLGAAKALRRPDLGRLSAGAKADIAVFDLRKSKFGPIQDPIRHLIGAGDSGDVEMVVVDGRTVLEDYHLTTVDEVALDREVHALTQQIWDEAPNFDYESRTVDQIIPPAFKMV